MATDATPDICLIMIVRDEAKNICRCLESVKELIDEYYICDTGSRDDTRDIIRDYMEICEIPGQVIEKEWIDFGANRDYLHGEAFKNCRSRYLLWLDADEIFLHIETNQFPESKHKAELLRKMDALPDVALFGLNTYMNTAIYQRFHISRNDRRFRWRSPVHEEIYTEDGYSYALLDDIYVPIMGVPENPKERYYRDIEILTKYVEEHPGNCTREIFYLAQSYRDVREWGDSLKYYEKYMDCKDGIKDFRYLSLLNIARIYSVLRDFAMAKYYYSQAQNEDEERVEAPHGLLLTLLDAKMLDEAHEFIKHYRLPEELKIGALVEPSIWYWEYDWLVAQVVVQLPYMSAEEKLKYLTKVREREELPRDCRVFLEHKIKFLEISKKMAEIENGEAMRFQRFGRFRNMRDL